MASTTASRWIRASPQAIWAVISDPRQMPNWWPGVTRVEGIAADRFTEVIPTSNGRFMRRDLSLVSVEPQRRLVWTQQLAGTPFERMLRTWATTITLSQGAGEGTLVTLAEHQQLRGYFRIGSLFQRRSAQRRLTAALACLSELLGGT